jgi:hypothetical protein
MVDDSSHSGEEEKGVVAIWECKWRKKIFVKSSRVLGWPHCSKASVRCK